MIRDKTAEKLALLVGDARFHYAKYTCLSTTDTKNATYVAIRKCYHLVPESKMIRKFPEIYNSLDAMLRRVEL